MTSTPVLRQSIPKEPKIRVAAPRCISPRITARITVGWGVLWIVGAAAAWTVVVVLFHNLMARLLS